MLREIRYVKQERKKDRRRWFTDDYWDLYVWIRPDGTYSGFQLCYGKTDVQRALTWMEGAEPVHAGISEEENPTDRNRAALLVADGFFDVAEVTRRFSQDAGNIDTEIRAYVQRKLARLSTDTRVRND